MISASGSVSGIFSNPESAAESFAVSQENASGAPSPPSSAVNAPSGQVPDTLYPSSVAVNEPDDFTAASYAAAIAFAALTAPSPTSAGASSPDIVSRVSPPQSVIVRPSSGYGSVTEISHLPAAVRLISAEKSVPLKLTCASARNGISGTETGGDGDAPPEQYGFTQTDERSDIYALGVTIKLLLKDNYERSPLRTVAEKCMRFNPEERYATAQKVKRAVMLRHYHEVPIACAAVVAAAGIALDVLIMLNETDDILVSAPESQTTEQSVVITTDTVTTTDTDVHTETTAEITTVEQTSGIIAETFTIVNAITFTDNSTAPQTTEAASVAESANLEISFLPKDIPALPVGITKVDGTEHVRKIEWDKLGQDDASTLIDNITEWLGDSVDVDDKTTQMGRTIQWKCSDNNIFSGYIILLYVEDTEKYSAFPQCRISIADSEK